MPAVCRSVVAMFDRDQRVTVPDPDGDGRIAARFLEVAPIILARSATLASPAASAP